jgi:hypothetical protein
VENHRLADSARRASAALVTSEFTVAAQLAVAPDANRCFTVASALRHGARFTPMNRRTVGRTTTTSNPQLLHSRSVDAQSGVNILKERL